MADDCDICDGSGYIRLPVRPRVSAVTTESTDVQVSPSPSTRTYPCPQCANVVSDDHVKVLDYNMMVDALYMSNQNYLPEMKRAAAHAMADRLAADGFVTYRISKDEDAFGKKRLRAELGVVSPAHVATLEARIAERQAEVATEVANEARRLIDNWGSYYGQTGLSKSDAYREIGEALKNVLRRRGHEHG